MDEHIMEVAPQMAYDYVISDIEYVIERAPNPQWKIRDFVNPRSSILAYAISGRAHYLIDGTPYEITGGDLLLMAPGTPHTAASSRERPWRFFSVAFTVTDSQGGDVSRYLRSLPTVTSITHGEIVRHFHEMFSVWTHNSPGHLLRIRAGIALALHRIIAEYDVPDQQQPYTRRMARIADVLSRNYDRTYSVEELAALADLSPSHFRTVFKRATGMTATQYQQQIKIGKATEFLASGEYNVTETARTCGFRDVYYFSHLYKKLTGSNPSAIARG